MTSKERIHNILNRKPVDRIGSYEHFWAATNPQWIQEGLMEKDEDVSDHFNFDIREHWSLNLVADTAFGEKTVEEDEDTVTYLNGNGATLRKHKKHTTTPEHVAFSVKDRNDWEEKIKPLLKAAPDRIDFAAYRKARENAAHKNLFFTLSGINVFEAIHPVCGHENMLMGMALDPDWVSEMASTYAELIVNLHEILFEKEGLPDGIWYYEDMGFKERPFMSAQMYRELIGPAHKKTIDFAHAKGLKVIMHSCGFVEPLLPDMVESGIDCLQVIEIKAGMEPLRIKKNFGDRIALCGGFDARNLANNDIPAIKRELDEKIPALKEGFGYILHSDHSVPESCTHETYKFFIDYGLRLGTY